ncbi:Aste57867_13929 [Aphanomyces stellatus]|uniref:Aste57867_13929 protein n=1 Tax=Aphanomyces stellatus TaxID=120398 RepID=A0A485KZC9_9STRA|nr:hypothetical protein As57867_013878 [Aphanomyces stellatus]VFT90759.1 Aste57867_13929 [Aphanomyces stellatus]
MDDFLLDDLKEGSGEWQNIQSVLRSTFYLLLESSERQERRLEKLERHVEEMQRSVEMKADKTYVQRTVQHAAGDLSANRDTLEHPSTTASVVKKVEALQLQVHGLEVRVGGGPTAAPSDHCEKTARRVQYVEDELRLIVPIIDKKADVDAVHACLAQTKESLKEALKKRAKASVVERELKKVRSAVDHIALEQHPDTKAQLGLALSRQQQQEVVLARLAYFVQKVDPTTKDDVAQLHQTVRTLETKVETMLQLKIKTDEEPEMGEVSSTSNSRTRASSIVQLAEVGRVLLIGLTELGTNASREFDDTNGLSFDDRDMRVELTTMQHQLQQQQQEQPSTTPAVNPDLQVKVLELDATVKEVIQAMNQLVNQLPISFSRPFQLFR